MRSLALLLLCTIVSAAETELVLAKVTAYCPCTICCSPSADGTTSTGLKTDRHPYGIAADPRALPYGTRVRVPGYLEVSRPGEWFTVDDTGGDMRRSWEDEKVIHIDVRYRNHAWAKRWGTQWLWIEVVRQ